MLLCLSDLPRYAHALLWLWAVILYLNLVNLFSIHDAAFLTSSLDFCFSFWKQT
jgi:hypothetical protein